jgi:thioesterase domain-containing protein
MVGEAPLPPGVESRQAAREPEDLAVRPNESLPPYSCLVPAKAGRKQGPALFIIAGLGGTVGRLLALGRLLETPMPVYAIRARGLDGLADPDTRVEDKVWHFLREIKITQPVGPYFLCGYSFGGLVAFEIARVLLEAGEQVAKLVLLDTPVDSQNWPTSYFVRHMAGRALSHICSIRQVPVRRLVPHIFDITQSLSRHLLLRLGVVKVFQGSQSGALSPAERDVLMADRLAFARFRPKFYPGEMIYFSAEIASPVSLDPEVIWRRRVRDLVVHKAGGDHLSMIDWPQVGRLAKDLNALLG